MAVALGWRQEATRAARTALPLLEKASRVAILSAPKASSREFDPARLQEFLAARGVAADLEVISGSGDPAPMLLGACKAIGASLLVSGRVRPSSAARIHLRRTTRSLLHADTPSLFLSH